MPLLSEILVLSKMFNQKFNWLNPCIIVSLFGHDNQQKDHERNQNINLVVSVAWGRIVKFRSENRG